MYLLCTIGVWFEINGDVYLQNTCKVAQEQLKKAKIKHKLYYNKKSRDRNFKVGDDVLLFLPTDNNKLLLQWKGPFSVVAKISNTDYQIDVNGKVRTFHANLLKLYIHRNSQVHKRREADESNEDDPVVTSVPFLS